MGKSRKTSNNNKSKTQCYVLLSRKMDGNEPTTEIPDESKNDVEIVEDVTATPTINLASFDQIHDATMESNELVKEIIYNVRLLRKEVADLKNHLTSGCGNCEKVPE